MKTKIVLAFVFSAILPLQAQLFSPESLNWAAFGGLTGALLGCHNPGQAAAIGAGSGFLFGSLLHESRPEPYGYYGPYASGYYAAPQPYYYSHAPYAYGVQPAPHSNTDSGNVVSQPPTVTQVQPPPSDPPAPAAPVRRPSPPTRMSSANSLFGR